MIDNEDAKARSVARLAGDVTELYEMLEILGLVRKEDIPRTPEDKLLRAEELYTVLTQTVVEQENKS